MLVPEQEEEEEEGEVIDLGWTASLLILLGFRDRIILIINLIIIESNVHQPVTVLSSNRIDVRTVIRVSFLIYYLTGVMRELWERE